MVVPLATRFEAFTVEHLMLIAGFLAVCFALAVLGRSHRGTPGEVRFRRGFALLIPCFTVPMQVLQLLPGDYDIATSLPLQLCDFAWMAAIVALWTRHWAATALVYYWGLTLTVQGILTPSLEELFPDPRYFMFWGMHFLTVWAAVYLTFGLGVRLTWRSFRLAFSVTSLWAVAVIVFNAVAGTNYGYLNRKPSVGTLLDLFGPWPGYVVVEVLVIAGVWALMTWPWVRPPDHCGPHDQTPTLNRRGAGWRPWQRPGAAPPRPPTSRSPSPWRTGARRSTRAGSGPGTGPSARSTSVV
jgi:hypothetical integral membrane protein (TIGR02206 family)